REHRETQRLAQRTLVDPPFELDDHNMFDRVLPKCLDNSYRGHKLALWLFGLLVFMKSVIGLNSIFNGAAVMSTADGIALSTYPAAAAQNLVALSQLFAAIPRAHSSRSLQPQWEIRCRAARIMSMRRDIVSSSTSFVSAIVDQRAFGRVPTANPVKSSWISARVKPRFLAKEMRARR